MEVFFPGSNSEEDRLNGTEIGVIEYDILLHRVR